MRGPLTSLRQVLICGGLVVGYFTCYGTTRLAGSLSRRLPFILLTILSALYVVLLFSLLPPSPHRLIEHGRQNKAGKVWDMLGVKHEDRLVIEQEVRLERVDEVGRAVQAPQQEHAKPGSATFEDMFAKEAGERTLLVVFSMSFSQLCGIDAVLYVSPFWTQEHILIPSVRTAPVPASWPCF